MRTLHVIRRLDPRLGGAPAACTHLSIALRERGSDVTIASTTSDLDGSPLLADYDVGIKVQLFPRTPAWPYDVSISLFRWLWRVTPNYDVVEVHGVFDAPAIFAMWCAKLHGVPFIVHPHGSLDPFDLQKHSHAKNMLGRAVLRRLLGASAMVIATSAREARQFRFTDRAAVRVAPLPYACSAERGDGSRFRRGHDIADSAILILFLGRVDYKKGIEHLVGAAELLLRRDQSVRLVVVGSYDTEYGKRVHDMATCRLGSAVAFTGHLSGQAKADALDAADVFVLVSDNENYGLSLVDAAAAGLPLVVSAEVYLSDELAQAGAAVISERNPDAVAAAIDDLVEDPTRRERMAKAAQRVVEDGIFSRTQAAARHHELRLQLLAQRRLGTAV